MSSVEILSEEDLGNKRSLSNLNKKKVVKKVAKKKTPTEDDAVASHNLGSKTGSNNNLIGNRMGSRNNLGSRLSSVNNITGNHNQNSKDNLADIDEDKDEVTVSRIISYKTGQVSTMTSDDIEKLLGDKERLLGELYTAELEIDRLAEENENLKNTIEEQKQTISKLLINNNENGIVIPHSDDDNNITVIGNNNDIEKEKLLKKI